ncbi:MAG: ABC transporter permease [Nitrospirota bacterium]
MLEIRSQRAEPVSPLMVLNSFVKHRSLIIQMAKREVAGRYRGSLLGLAWSLVHPLVMLGVYTFVFSVVFKSRWGDAAGTDSEFVMLLFCGLIVHSLFAECVNRAPTLIVNNANYVKKVVFPLEILPCVSLGSALFFSGVNVGVLLLFYGVVHFSLHWTVLLFPLLLMPFALFTLGVSWFLASIGVFIQDIRQAIGIVTTVMLFLAPIFYPVTVLPEAYRPLLYLNPLTFVVEQARDVLILGKLPSWQGLGVYFLCSVIAACLGLLWFQKTRKGFADVI